MVRLLRIVHCPARHDFGLRYLDTDLPEGYAARVEALLPGPDLATRAAAAFAWQDELLGRARRPAEPTSGRSSRTLVEPPVGLLVDRPLVLLELLLVDHDRPEERPDR